MESQPFEKFSVTLPGEMARVIHERVSSGDYGSVSELIQDAMRAWLHRERRLAVLDASLVRGMAEVDAGQGENAEQVQGTPSTTQRRGLRSDMTRTFAPAAKRDLLNIGENIKRDNLVRAVTVVEELVDRCSNFRVDCETEQGEEGDDSEV